MKHSPADTGRAEADISNCPYARNADIELRLAALDCSGNEQDVGSTVRRGSDLPQIPCPLYIGGRQCGPKVPNMSLGECIVQVLLIAFPIAILVLINAKSR